MVSVSHPGFGGVERIVEPRAIIVGGLVKMNGELDVKARSRSWACRGLGAVTGNRVALFTKSAQDALAAYFWVLASCGCVIRHNPRLVSRELLHALRDDSPGSLLPTAWLRAVGDSVAARARLADAPGAACRRVKGFGRS